MKKLGQLLVEKGLLSDAQLQEALELQRQGDNRFLGSIVISKGWIGPDQLLALLSEQYAIPCVQLGEAAPDREAIEQVPLKLAMHYKILPLRLHDSVLTIAVANPSDVRVLDELSLALQQRYVLDPVLALEEDILKAVKKHYGMGAETIHGILQSRQDRGIAHAPKEDTIANIEQLDESASVVKLVNQLILEAHEARATDIHLEPFRNKISIRYRIDGKLHHVDAPPTIRQLFSAIVSRVKVMSNLNLVERRLAQDGRASVMIGKEKLDLRVSVVPVPCGESVVIRILPNRPLIEFRELGFREQDLEVLRRQIRKPHGMLLVTGPTGSGKTTTLYTCLKEISTEDRKIITIEDPIEYEMAGNTQIQVNPQIGLSFAQGLRSMLRHDPDVIMVGEIRDPETAEIAIRVALTGHFVISSLHTNDACSAVIRLLDMGIDAYLISSSVDCVIAQRLVRLLCPQCKEPSSGDGPGTLFKPKGCKKCHRTGFLGRIAIYEMMLMTEPIQRLVLQKADADEIRRTAVEMGMRTMLEDGEEKVRQGLTTMDEVILVAQDE